jgi:hypothetical protein
MKGLVLHAAVMLALAGAAPGSVLVEFECRAEVVGTGEYDEASGGLDVVLRVVEVREAITGHSIDTFMEYNGEVDTAVFLNGVDSEAASLVVEGSEILVLYHHVSGLFEDGGGYSSEEWTYHGISRAIHADTAPVPAD